MNKYIKDYIKVYDNTLDSNFCKTLIDDFDRDWVSQLSTGGEEPSYELGDYKNYKKFTEIDFSRSKHWKQSYDKVLRSKILEYTKLYFADLNYPDHLMINNFSYEEFRIKRYIENTNDRIDDHTDATGLGLNKRWLSLFWYLNDVETGGETRLTDINYHVKPKAGRLLMFPPMWMFPHAGLPVVSGTKYILHTYLHYSTTNMHDFHALVDASPNKSGAVQHKTINKE